MPVAASVWNARAAPDLAESAGAVLACSFQVAIAGGAFIGSALFDGAGPSGVIVYAGSAAAIGAALMLTSGRSVERVSFRRRDPPAENQTKETLS